MADLKEKNKWETGIYRIEENDPVHGGEDGVTNKPIKQLANRTVYLKNEVEKKYEEKSATTEEAGTVQLVDNVTTNDNTKALTAKQGFNLKNLINALTSNLSNYIPNSKKSSAINSNSEDTIATSKAAKTAYDKGKNALDKANAAYDESLKKTGNQELNNGALRINSGDSGWSYLGLGAGSGYWRLEVSPNSENPEDRRFNMLYISGSGSNAYLRFPTIGNGEFVAYQSWVDNKFKNPIFYNTQEDKNLNNILGTRILRFDGNAKGVPQEWKGNTSDFNGIQVDSEIQRFQIAVGSEDDVFCRINDSTNSTNDSHWSEWSRLLTNNNIKILTGTINHGATIPLPAGFSENECKFFVSIKHSNPNNGTWDIEETNSRNHFYLECFTNGRNVTARLRTFDDKTDSYKYYNMTANYMVIGVK